MDFLIGTEAENGVDGVGQVCIEAKSAINELSALELCIASENCTGEEKAAVGGGGGGGSSSDASLSGRVHLVALARLLLGACCEAYLIKKSNRTCKSGYRPHSTAAKMKLSRLYTDSCHAACWTSAHALYIHDVLQDGINVARPSVHSVKSELNEPDLTQVFDHRFAHKHVVNTDASCMLSLLTRCTNPGARGWDSTLEKVMSNSPSTRRICSDALLVSVTGMHSCIHPAARPHWKSRLGLTLHLSNESLLGCITKMCSNPVALKEIVRRLLSNSISPSYATTHALEHLDHPVAHLAGNLQTLCPDGLEFSSMAFINAGRKVTQSLGKMSLDEAIERSTQFELINPVVLDMEKPAIRWFSGYLGKGSSSIHNRVPATVVTSSLWATAFRCNFIPFWLHGSSHEVRVSRLNHSQHLALHESNAATRLTLLLAEKEQLHLQRLALKNPSSGLMTLEDVGSSLGLYGVRGTSCNGGTKNQFDTLQSISAAGAKGASEILQFCRVASISENILIYDLGERTKKLQTMAIFKRSLVDELPGFESMTEEKLMSLVPEHTKHLCACVECRRVSNAITSDAGEQWRSGFNEIGTSASMVATDPETNEMTIRCAKRGSTSFKSAVACEEEMCAKNIETLDVKEGLLTSAFDANTQRSSNGVAARIRRDAKNSLEQRNCSVACGSEAMLSIPLIGKAVRLWDNWYALCSFCGCFMRFHPNNKYETELCCLRCDHDMLNRHDKAVVMPDTKAAPACRFCGKVSIVT